MSTIDDAEHREKSLEKKTITTSDDLLQDNQSKFAAVEQSPFEEVAAAVPNTDDVTMMA
ncbi:unnamed protein product, partial [Didymodactylos carnosus]